MRIDASNNALFIADCHDRRIPDAEIRNRIKSKHYGKLNMKYATGWWAMAGRKPKAQHSPQEQHNGT